MQLRPRAERISELRDMITGLVNHKRYLLDLMHGNRERNLASIVSLRRQAQEFIVKADRMEAEMSNAKELYISADERVAELRQDIINIQNEEEIAKLGQLAEQYEELKNAK